MARSEGQNQILLSVDLTSEVRRLLCTLRMEWRLHRRLFPLYREGRKESSEKPELRSYDWLWDEDGEMSHLETDRSKYVSPLIILIH